MAEILSQDEIDELLSAVTMYSTASAMSSRDGRL